MKHSFLDKYSALNSLIHRLDARVKIISCLAYIFFVILTLPDRLLEFAGYFSLIFILILLSRVPIGYILKRSLVILPFVILVAAFLPFFKEGKVAGSWSIGALSLTITYGGLSIFWNVLVKSYLAILSLTLFSSTTKFPEFLKALEKLYIPKILIILLSFMYRYIFVLIDEAQRMEQARRARYFGRNYLRQVRVFANMIGLLFIRTYERAERVYQSMRARCFDGEILTLNRLCLGRVDILYLATFIGLLGAIKLWK